MTKGNIMESYHVLIRSQFGFARVSLEAQSPQHALCLANELQGVKFSPYTLMHRISAIEVYRDSSEKSLLADWHSAHDPGYPEASEVYRLVAAFLRHARGGRLCRALLCASNAIRIAA
jgi:hypothetical protein